VADDYKNLGAMSSRLADRAKTFFTLRVDDYLKGLAKFSQRQ
jgi:hypothetical protein